MDLVARVRVIRGHANSKATDRAGRPEGIALRAFVIAGALSLTVALALLASRAPPGQERDAARLLCLRSGFLPQHCDAIPLAR
jgi:hypothetical protein